MDLNEELLTMYAACKDGAEVIAVQNAVLQQWEAERAERGSVELDLPVAGGEDDVDEGDMPVAGYESEEAESDEDADEGDPSGGGAAAASVGLTVGLTE